MTFTSSSPCCLPVCRPILRLNSIRWLLTVQRQGFSGDAWIYWMLNDEKGRRRLVDHPSQTIDINDDIFCHSLVRFPLNWIMMRLTVIISLSMSSSFSTLSIMAFAIDVRLGMSASLSLGQRYRTSRWRACRSTNRNAYENNAWFINYIYSKENLEDLPNLRQPQVREETPSSPLSWLEAASWWQLWIR